MYIVPEGGGAEALLYTKRYYQSPSGTCSLRAQGHKRQAFDDVRRLTTCFSFRLSLLVRTSYMIRRGALSIPLHIYISKTSESVYHVLITIGRRRARWARATAVFRLTQYLFGRLHRSVWRLKNAWNQTRALLYLHPTTTPSIHTTRSFSVQCYRLCLHTTTIFSCGEILVVCIRSIWYLGCFVLCAAFHHLGISAAICGAFSEQVLVAPNRNICFCPFS